MKMMSKRTSRRKRPPKRSKNIFAKMYYALIPVLYDLATIVAISIHFQRNVHRYAAISFATIVANEAHFVEPHWLDS
jgi:hypothetical protein